MTYGRDPFIPDPDFYYAGEKGKDDFLYPNDSSIEYDS